MKLRGDPEEKLFTWVGCVLSQRGRDRRRENLKHYSAFKYGSIEGQLGDFVLISNFDSVDPDSLEGCDVAKILQLYELEDAEEPHRAVVQWYSRPQQLPKKFSSHKLPFPELNTDCEVLEDKRNFDTDVSIESFFGKCQVVQAMPEEDPKDVIGIYDGGSVAVFVVRFQFCSQRGKERIEILPMSLEKCEGLDSHPRDGEEKANKERKPRSARKPIPPTALRDGGGSSDDESMDRSSSPEIKSTGQPSLRYILLPKESSGEVENGESAKKKRALPTEGSNTPRKSTMGRSLDSPAGSSSKKSEGARRALRDKDISGLLEEDEDDDEEEGEDAVQPQYQSSILSPSRMKLKRIVEPSPVAATPPGTPKRKVARSKNNESPCPEFGSITKGSVSTTPSLKKTASSKGDAVSVKTPARSSGIKSKTPRTPSDQAKTTPRSLKNVSARKRLQLLADMGLSGGSGGIAERGSHAGPLATPLSPLGEARARLHVSATPKCLPCRDEEFSSVYSFIEDKILDGVGGCMYVCGVPGTGKTATVRMAVERLKEESQKGNVPEFEFAEINGMRVTEPRRAYSQLLKALTGRAGASPEEARDALEQRFSRPAPRRLSTLLLVDELDLLCTRRQDVVYNLMDWPSRAHSRLVVITIANTMDLPERVLMSKVCSRMGLTRLTFHPYTFQQLQEIVMSRMEGLKAFDPDAVQLVARKVAAVSGDARRALDICRRAAECAESELLGQEKLGNQTPTARRKSLKAMKGVMVSMRHVDQAVSEMISTSKAKAIQSCSELEKLFLQSVASEVERTGVEEAGFERVHSVFRTLCTYSGFRLPTVTDTMGICWRLGSLRLLLTEPSSRADILQRVMLNVDVDSVHYALRVDQKQ
ncbi:origin recognition complex subunit 1 isoform X2 [Ischnura elegans]|uniref:origin recognition complex subunit 1 isoform X2 n=1 Tax=Ischnura elegans TaxID=197161 RepID=UPI001ED8B852|nr:origin recognition complex subunit 1 isoform X2 [Ischnura elegans]